MKKFIFLLMLAIGAFFTCKQAAEKSVPQVKEFSTDVAVKTAAVSKGNTNATIDALAIVKSASEARPAFKTGGIIYKTYVKEGEVVKKGQLLASLIMTEIDAQVAQALQSKQKAERDLKRVNNLFADSVATLEQLENVTTAFEVSKQTYEIAQFNRTHSLCKSPINGKVIKQLLNSGDVAAPGMPVFAVVGTQIQDWKATVSLIDKDWAIVQTGDTVAIAFDAYPTEKYEGIVAEKSSISTNMSGTFDVDIRFKNPPKHLAVGLTAKVSIHPKKSISVVTIPIESLVESNGSVAAIFHIEEGLAKRSVISIAEILGDRVVVSSGLEGITEVVTTGSLYLEEGDKVRKVN